MEGGDSFVSHHPAEPYGRYFSPSEKKKNHRKINEQENNIDKERTSERAREWVNCNQSWQAMSSQPVNAIFFSSRKFEKTMYLCAMTHAHTYIHIVCIGCWFFDVRCGHKLVDFYFYATTILLYWICLSLQVTDHFTPINPMLVLYFSCFVCSQYIPFSCGFSDW